MLITNFNSWIFNGIFPHVHLYGIEYGRVSVWLLNSSCTVYLSCLFLFYLRKAEERHTNAKKEVSDSNKRLRQCSDMLKMTEERMKEQQALIKSYVT